jgi:cytochrome b6-f complex iron-sulfur subunit
MLTSLRSRRAEKSKPGYVAYNKRTPGDNEEEVLEKLSRERFIRLGTALGVGAACASLVACGGGAASSGGGSGGGKSGGGNSGGDSSGGGNSGGESQASSSSSGNASGDSTGGSKSGGGSDGGNAGGGKQKASGGDAKAGGPAIASTSEVAPGSAVAFGPKGNPAVLVHLDSGDFVAYSAICTHQGCTVAYQGGQLACPCHGSVFDPANGGAVVTGPATTPLPEIPVKVQGGEVTKA